ncbi:hypothetical protein [Microtetraspora fusca]|uniref:LysR substrate-binding domain-containing protein n=1 Tax=Microtetraspora fusca TaxID=1997 RepID=A0ABW6VGJ4_MICFU|nr:hypothetical protein [Microtetraspora fusca]
MARQLGHPHITLVAMTGRVARALARIRRATPRLDVTVRVTGRQEVVAAVATGDSSLGLIALVAAGHGLAVLPAATGPTPGVRAVPATSPRLVHRTELLHGRIAGPAAAALVAALTGHPSGAGDHSPDQ